MRAHSGTVMGDNWNGDVCHSQVLNDGQPTEATKQGARSSSDDCNGQINPVEGTLYDLLIVNFTGVIVSKAQANQANQIHTGNVLYFTSYFVRLIRPYRFC